MKKAAFPATVSFWEIEQYLTGIDLLIVGSGIVGLTSAIFYKRVNPRAKVLIIEKGFLPAGASTKNAGFACFGSASEILSDLRTASEEAVYKLVMERVDGLRALRALIGDKEMDYRTCGGYEVFREEDSELFEKCSSFIPLLNKELENRLAFTETYSIADDEIGRFGFSGVEHLLLNKQEGALDTGKMMATLLKLAAAMDILILNGLELSEFADIDAAVAVKLKNGFNLTCRKLHIATNGFASSILPHLDVKPARAQVLITSPIKNLQVKGTFHMNEGFYYFRNIGNRVLLGGGRQLDVKGETSTDICITELIQNNLDHLLRTVILPDATFTVDHRWAGIMGVGNVKKTLVERISDNVTCAVRLGGMGVAIGTSIGQRSASLIG